MTNQEIYENAKKNSLNGAGKKKTRMVIANPKRFMTAVFIASTVAITGIGYAANTVKGVFDDKIALSNFIMANKDIVTSATFRTDDNLHYFYNASKINDGIKERDIEFDKALYTVYENTSHNIPTMDDVCRLNGYESFVDYANKAGYETTNDWIKDMEKSIIDMKGNVL